MKKPKNNLDYIILYSERLKKDNSLFKQQKMIIESQMKASSSLFRKMFRDKNFRTEARKYLRAVTIIK